MSEQRVLLGRDHGEVGQATYDLLADGRALVGISAGSDPGLVRAKHDPAVPNEDAVLAHVGAKQALLAVADGHIGHEASHHLIRGLAEGDAASSRSPRQLREALAGLVAEPGQVPMRAGSTLLACVVEPRLRRGFGCSYGDSSAMLLGARGPRLLSQADQRYVRPVREASLGEGAGRPFVIAGDPGDVLVVFTDGVNECCYGDPARSVQPEHLQDAWDLARGELASFGESLLRLALEGVGGQPGGEDNVAFAAVVLGVRRA